MRLEEKIRVPLGGELQLDTDYGLCLTQAGDLVLPVRKLVESDYLHDVTHTALLDPKTGRFNRKVDAFLDELTRAVEALVEGGATHKEVLAVRDALSPTDGEKLSLDQITAEDPVVLAMSNGVTRGKSGLSMHATFNASMTCYSNTGDKYAIHRLIYAHGQGSRVETDMQPYYEATPSKFVLANPNISPGNHIQHGWRLQSQGRTVLFYEETPYDRNAPEVEERASKVFRMNWDLAHTTTGPKDSGLAVVQTRFALDKCVVFQISRASISAHALQIPDAPHGARIFAAGAKTLYGWALPESKERSFKPREVRIWTLKS